MSEEKIKSIEKVLESFDETERNGILGVVLDFLNIEYKNVLAKSLEEKTVYSLFISVLCLTNLCEPEFEIAKDSTIFKKIYNLLIKSKNENKIDTDLHRIYSRQKKITKNWLLTRKGQVLKRIIGTNWDNYKYLLKVNELKAKRIYDKSLSRADHEIKNILKAIERELEIFDFNPLFIILNTDILECKWNNSDFLEILSFFIYSPKHQLSRHLQIEPKWESFPLKWYSYNQPLSLIKALFFYYKRGVDISKHFIQKYQNHDFGRIEKLLGSHYFMPPNSTILDGRKTVIDEIIDCYKNKNYSAVVCTALPLIEGLIWEFSYLLNKRGLGIYKNNELNVLMADNGIELREFTVGYLLNKSKFKNYLDDHFIRYFCNELYKERNPVLHGKEFSSFNEKNASMKMITLEYLLETINRNIENYMMEGLQKKLPEDFKFEIREMIRKAKKFNQPNATDPKSRAVD